LPELTGNINVHCARTESNEKLLACKFSKGISPKMSIRNNLIEVVWQTGQIEKKQENSRCLHEFWWRNM